MAEFPRLKTGAVAQFPMNKTLDFNTEVLRFVDGSEQRFRNAASVMQRWSISVDLLDESEIQAIQQFVTDQAGRFGSFTFTDPWDEAVYDDCSFESDEINVTLDGPSVSRTELIIRRNRA